jgi:hypothetical protein
MTVPVARKPNIEPGLQDQTNIALNLFNTILDTANTQAELNRSWATIEQHISAQERWKLGIDNLGINHNFLFPSTLIFFSCP